VKYEITAALEPKAWIVYKREARLNMGASIIFGRSLEAPL